MDKFEFKIDLFKSPPAIYFSFTDPFIQKYYNYDLRTLVYYLKLALLLGKRVDITAANLWQSNLSMQLFMHAQQLNQCGLVNLAIRQRTKNNSDFSSYFKQRFDESSHFIPLPGILSFLDYQLPETLKVAKELDYKALANERKAGNVTNIYSNNIIREFAKTNNQWMIDDINKLYEDKSISRSTIADVILRQPLTDNLKISLIIEANNLLQFSNAEANGSQLICPMYHRDNIVLEYPKSNLNFIYGILNSIHFPPSDLNIFSFNSFYLASKLGVLDRLQKYIWILRTNNSLLLTRFVRCLAKHEVRQMYSINKNEKYIPNFQFDLKLGTDYLELFHSNLNSSMLFMSNDKIMENNTIDLSVLMQEFTDKLDMEELKNISVEMFGDYQIIDCSNNKLTFVRELCLKCKRQNRLPEVLKRAMRINPTINILSKDIDIRLSDLDWKGDGNIKEVGSTISKEKLEQIIYDYSRFQPIDFLEKGFAISKRICMISGKKFAGTGFWINKEYIITNKHVISDIDKAREAEIWLNYESSSRSDNFEKYTLNAESLIVSSKYDLALCKVEYKESDYLDDFPPINYGVPIKDDLVPIIQHPNGAQKQICIGHNSLKYFDEECIQYLTDTLPGSSGAPVFDSKWNLIGIHRAGSNIAAPRSGGYYLYNEGISIKCVREFLVENGIELI